MNTKLFQPTWSHDERMAALQNNAEKAEETTYHRDLAPDEVDAKREVLVDNLIKVSNLEDELEKHKAYYKGQIKPLQQQNRILQQEVKTRKAEFKGVLYHMADYEQNIMETYDHNGEFVSSRRLLPEERKSKVLSFSKPAVNE